MCLQIVSLIFAKELPQSPSPQTESSVFKFSSLTEVPKVPLNNSNVAKSAPRLRGQLGASDLASNRSTISCP
ncbi:hypothetical protein BpHYR1_023567 [Brachionus plicatilis]|uniref:Uncharacterized protein n=1 Tax=Brachionus plicatilis TaxID=10195 RepID=A0A3M7PZ21_BRAPC|nr:hypothetical protein BpHYR1_023567 [Brachionus plicatilis]